jgi:hypothetical protein
MQKQTNDRFAAMQKRIDERFAAVQRELTRLQNTTDWLAIELSPLMGRVGRYFEAIVRRIIERSMGLEKGKIERLTVGEVEIDAYVHNKYHVLYEVKSNASRSDARLFLRDATEIEQKLGITARKVIVCFTIEDVCEKFCQEHGIEVILPESRET